MHLPIGSVRTAPYGLAFPIADLVRVRNWAARHRLRLRVALDQVLEEFEFEEMLILTEAGRPERTLTIWQTRGGLFAQTQRGRPRPFPCLQDALDAHEPQAGRGTGWLRRLGRTGLMIRTPRVRPAR